MKNIFKTKSISAKELVKMTHDELVAKVERERTLDIIEELGRDVDMAESIQVENKNEQQVAVFTGYREALKDIKGGITKKKYPMTSGIIITKEYQ